MNRAGAAMLATIFLFSVFPSEAKQARRGTDSSAVNNSDDFAKQGAKRRRAQEAQERKWDLEMGKMMKSICRGC
jgi:hypothetical protein